VTPLLGARFDDLVAGRALAFPRTHHVLIADRPEDVVPVLAEVERATRDGAWAVGYLAYEAAAGLDPRLAVAASSPDDPPLAWFGLCDRPAVVTPVERSAGSSAAAPWTPDWTAQQHASAVARVREQIAAGVTSQCNLTDRLRARFDGDPFELYTALALAQRGAYNAYLDLGRHVIASASPELFFDWDGDRIRTRPMKGTAARGRDTCEDRERARELQASPKERAENLMAVDLMRDDLARVASAGSIDVPELFALERYPTVWQLTSEVTARTGGDVDLVDIFRALFPSGSVTGSPKAAAMRLIRDLECRPRGVYCGAVGFVAPPGGRCRARFNVAIRTAVVDRERRTGVYGSGGGITWVSDPAAEHAELLAKAAILSEPTEEHELLETLAYCPGEGLRNLDRHLSRMADSAEYFWFRYDAGRVREALACELADVAEPRRVRIALARSGQFSIEVSPTPLAASRPVLLALDDEPVDSTSVWLAHKTTRRAVFTTRAARHAQADDVVLLNERGEVTQTTIANLAVQLEGRWWTPPVRSGCLPGVERGRLLDAGALHEQVLRPADLHRASDLAVVSSLRGWRPARLLNCD
jgi:para-aminobenzoate synthetase/4-amino-4-deoxychorismate lyase